MASMRLIWSSSTLRFFNLEEEIPGIMPEDLVEGPHLLELGHLVEEVLQVELLLAQLFLQLPGLLLVVALLGLVDEGEHVAHAQDARGHAVGVEGLEVLELLAHADELDGLAGDRLDGEGRAAAGVAVQLGEDDAVEVHLLVRKVSATLTASWPVMASTTSMISWGLTRSLTRTSSSIMSSSMWRRPAVSMITVS